MMQFITQNFNLHGNSEEIRFFKTIGEVSAELQVNPHVLRFWESKFTSIRPHKRRGGHRYYSIADVEKIKEIKYLLYEKGFTIKGAQKFLKEKSKNKPMQTANFNVNSSPVQNITKVKEVEQQKPSVLGQASLFEDLLQNKEQKIVEFKDKNNTSPQKTIDDKTINFFIGELEVLKKALLES